VSALVRSLAPMALVLAAVACAHAPYPVEVAAGISPRLTPAEVERIAQVHGAGEITGMRCVYYDTLVEMFDADGNPVNHRPVWLVGARGPFGNPRYPGVEYEEGSWIIDDATGGILGSSGFSGNRRAPSPASP
jgi:hypothetical protein